MMKVKFSSIFEKVENNQPQRQKVKHKNTKTVEVIPTQPHHPHYSCTN